MKFPLTSAGRVALTTVAPGAGDNARGGLIVSSGGDVRAAAAAPTQFQQGLGFGNNGALCIVDATAGLPVGTNNSNGWPCSSQGSLCYSTGAIASVSNGIPFAANGAVAATVV